MAIDPDHSKGNNNDDGWREADMAIEARITARNREEWRTAVMAIDPGSQQGAEKQRSENSSHGDRPRKRIRSAKVSKVNAIYLVLILSR